MKICKKCSSEFEGENIYCNKCRWEMKWPSEILNAPELASRRKRSHNLKMLSIDKERAVAEFKSSTRGKSYKTTLENCTCVDFAMARGLRPCKHILRLADELGLFENEKFEANEKDYTTEVKTFYAPKIPLDLGDKIETIAEREGKDFLEQVHEFLEQGIEKYLQEKNLKFETNFILR